MSEDRSRYYGDGHAGGRMESIYRFGEFRLDPVRHELWRGSTEVALPRKVFACIVYLIQHRDRVVGREELMQSIWGHVHLTDSTLGQAIRQRVFTLMQAVLAHDNLVRALAERPEDFLG